MSKDFFTRIIVTLMGLTSKILGRSVTYKRSVPGKDWVSIQINRIRIINQFLPAIIKSSGGYIPAFWKMIMVLSTSGIPGIRTWVRTVREQERKSLYIKEACYYQNSYSFKQPVDCTQPGKIGIHIHLSNIGLLGILSDYLSNMPFDYDLFISVRDEVYADRARYEIEGLLKASSLKTAVVTGKGNSMAPLVTTFARELASCEYICHIHTMNSLPKDNETNNILSNLLGSDINILSIFHLFEEHKEIGLIYVEPSPDMPYWKYARSLYNSYLDTLLDRLGLENEYSQYMDCPSGSMFWAKADAIKLLLDSGLTYNDFTNNASDQSEDGGLSQAIEHLIIPAVRSSGMTFCEVNLDKGTYRINKGTRNLWQYWGKDLENLRKTIDNFEVISFDIFDTLLTRPVFVPDTVFDIVEIKIHAMFEQDLSYIACRKQAENMARKRTGYTGDCNLDEIYDEFEKITRLPEVDCNRIKQIEIQTEIDLCLPRQDMIDIFNYAISKGKRTILISDIYLNRQDMETMLSKCDITGYDEILISSSIRKRKDTGELWDHCVQYTDKSIWLHIGDNEHSDLQLPMNRGITCYHIMSGRSMFHNTSLGKRYCESFRGNISAGDSAILGTIVARLFNSPFALHSAEGKFIINDLKTMGYVVFGPVILTFLTWLITNLKKDRIDMVLFLAREGYFLEKLYNDFHEHLGGNSIPAKKVESRYFLASRRAISVASIFHEDDILDLIEAPYEGTLSFLLLSRFGITSEHIKCNKYEIVKLPDDYRKVKNILDSYKDQILESAETERNNYMKYCNDMDFFDHDNIAIVDLGYSGSMQYYLSKILNRPTVGYYFVTRNRLKGVQYQGNIMKDCFSNSRDLNAPNVLYDFVLLLEAILTSPDGQFIKFENDKTSLNPVFDKPGLSQHNFDSLEKIKEGISAFIEDMINLHGKYLFDLKISKDISGFLMEYIVEDKSFILHEIKKLFTVDDNYGSEKEHIVFDLYREFYGMNT